MYKRQGLAFAGAILVSGVIESGPGHISLTGVAFGVLSGVFLSMTSIFTKLAIDRGYQGITITFYSILTTAICTVPFTNWGAVVQYAIYSPGQHILYMAFHAIGTAVLPYCLLYTSRCV